MQWLLVSVSGGRRRLALMTVSDQQHVDVQCADKDSCRLGTTSMEQILLLSFLSLIPYSNPQLQLCCAITTTSR